MDIQNLQQEFNRLFNKPATKIYFCPGRVNLIGEHIDYNGGLVMPAAIDLGTYLLIAPNDDDVLRFRSLNFDETLDIPLVNHFEKTGGNWFNYPLGVIHYFEKYGHQLSGLDMMYYGNLPVSSGLSSSASIEVATAFALNDIFRGDYSLLDLVKLTKTVENTFIGVNSGIMDQFAVAFGQRDKAMVLNCETLAYEQVQVKLGDYVLVIINTNKPRNLAESMYNVRVQECHIALEALKKELFINNLCDIDTDTLYKHKHLITDETIWKRVRHIVEENDRVKLAAKLLNDGDLIGFGKLMYASHYSLKDLYEVSGKELDAIAAFGKDYEGVIGSRMTGAGFGGCAIALVEKARFNAYKKDITEFYTREIGYAPEVYETQLSNGVGLLETTE
jgi:galactokinase